MVNLFISSHFRPPVYLLAALLSFQDFGHLYSHYSEFFFLKTSYLHFFCFFGGFLSFTFISCIILFHFILSVSAVWVSFQKAGGLWLHCVVKTTLCGWAGTSDLSRFNAWWNWGLCSDRQICISSLWIAMNCPWIMLWGVSRFGMASCTPFYNIHYCVSVLLENSCGFSCADLAGKSVEIAFHVDMETLELVLLCSFK